MSDPEDNEFETERKRNDDEEWLKNPTIPGFSDTDIGRNDGSERILVWRHDPFAELIAEPLRLYNLDAYGCSIGTEFIDRFQPGFYAVLITGLSGNCEFIKKAHDRDPTMQIIVATAYLQPKARKSSIDEVLNSLRGLHVSLLLAVPYKIETVIKLVREVALPRHRSKLIPSDDDILFFSDEDFD